MCRRAIGRERERADDVLAGNRSQGGSVGDPPQPAARAFDRGRDDLALRRKCEWLRWTGLDRDAHHDVAVSHHGLRERAIGDPPLTQIGDGFGAIRVKQFGRVDALSREC